MNHYQNRQTELPWEISVNELQIIRYWLLFKWTETSKYTYMHPFVVMINIYVNNIYLNTCMYISVPILQLSFMSFLAVIPQTVFESQLCVFYVWYSSLKIDFFEALWKGQRKIKNRVHHDSAEGYTEHQRLWLSMLCHGTGVLPWALRSWEVKVWIPLEGLSYLLCSAIVYI